MVAGKWSKTLAADVYPRAAIVALGAGFRAVLLFEVGAGG
jgi:hypothetical protein